MTILKQSDGKIITNLGGEILSKSDALIDIRSTYGITKDGSNVVQSIKYFNNPSKRFHSPVNNPCIVNVKDNGFDFTSNITGYLQGVNFPNNQRSFHISFWAKFDITPTGFKAILSFDESAARNFQIYFTDISLNVYTGVAADIFGVGVSMGWVVWTDWAYFTFERDVNGYWAVLHNGIRVNVVNSINTTNLVVTNKGVLGNTIVAGGRAFNQKLDDLVVYNHNLYPCFGVPQYTQVFTPPIRSSSL